MMWKLLFVTVLAVGALAVKIPTEVVRQMIEPLLTEECKKDQVKVDEIVKAMGDYLETMQTLLNFDTIQSEVQGAKANGTLDQVFKKYCDRAPEVKTAIHTVQSKLLPCLLPNMRDRATVFDNDLLIDYVCQNDGKLLSRFITEQGPECVQSQASELQKCQENEPNLRSLSFLKKLTNEDECTKFDRMTSCLVRKMEGCTTPTPAKMLTDLFKYMHDTSTCNKVR